MRRLWLLALVVSLCGPVVSAGLDDGLVAHYPLDYGAGRLAHDVSGADNDADINSAAQWAHGNRGKGLVNTDSNGGLDLQQSYDSGANFTYMFWTKKTSDLQNDWEIFLANDASNDIFYIGDGGSTSRFGGDGIGHWDVRWNDLSKDWHHVAYVRRDSSHELYIDGELRDTISDASYQSPQIKALMYWGNDLTTYGFESGRYDDIRYYNQSLSAEEVKSVHNRGSVSTTEDTGSNPGEIVDIGFGKKNATHVFDTSGNRNHADIVNGATQRGAYRCTSGRCLKFDGNDDYVKIPSGSGLSLREFTVMGWMFRENNNSWHVLSENDAGVRNWWLGGWSGKDCVHFRTDDVNNSNEGPGCVAKSLPKQEWVHVAGTHTGDNGTMAIYINGRKVATHDFTGEVDTNTGPVTMGGTNYLPGRLDEVKIYNESLSQQQIIAEAGLKEAAAVLDMRLSEGGGDVVMDMSRENNYGTLKPDESSGPSWIQRGVGKALDFDGGDDYIEVSDDESLTSAFGKTTTFTISAEITPKDWVSYGAISKAAGGCWSESTNSLWTYSGGFRCVMGDGNGSHCNPSGSYVRTEPYQPSLNNSYEVTCVGDGDNLKMYADGELKDSVSISGLTRTRLDNSNPLIIGKRTASNGGAIDGKVHEVKVYPYAVSESKVEELYNKGASGRAGKDESPAQAPDSDNVVLEQSFDRVEMCSRSDTLSCPSGMSGNISVDTSGEANHGAFVNGGPETLGSGKCKSGHCLTFDGDNGDAVKVNSTVLSSGQQTAAVSAWVYIEENPGNSWNRFVDIQDGNGNNELTLYWDDDGDNYGFRGLGVRPRITGEDPPLQEWHHWAGVTNGSHAKFYFDGELQATGSLTQSTSDAVVKIGGRYDTTYDDAAARIDQVKVYNTSLSDEKIWSLYSQGRGRTDASPPGSLARWRFDDAANYTENFIPNGDFTDGNGVPTESGSWGTYEIGRLDNPGNSYYVLKQRTGEYEVHFKSGSEIQANTTYVMSAWVAYTDDWDGNYQIFHARWYDDNGSDYTTNGNGHLVETRHVNGLTWERRYETFTTPPSATGFNWYLGYSAGADTGWRYLTNVQLEAKDYPTRFVDGVRDERVPDSAGNHPGQMGSTTKIDDSDPLVAERGSGKALKFEGDQPSGTFETSPEFVEIPASERLRPKEAWSVTGWVKPRDLPQTYNGAGLFDYGDNNKISVQMRDNGVRVNAGGDWTAAQADFSEVGAGAGEYTHVTATYDNENSNGALKLYFDGKLVDSTTGVAEPVNHTKSAYIGRRRDHHQHTFNGTIDDVRLYPYALTHNQVKAVMNQGSIS